MKYIETKPGFVKATGNCVFGFGHYETKEFPVSELEAYKNGAYIQDALRSLPADDREFIMSDISPKGWHNMYANEHTEYDDPECE